MNLGLSPELKTIFSNIEPEKKENISNYKIPNPNWVAGFSSGEACFIVDIFKSKSNKIGYSVNLRVMISQHARDELLLCSLINYFNCGKLYKNNNCFNLTIRKFADIDTKIIPFFFKYPILGNKILDFQDFCKVGKLVKETSSNKWIKKNKFNKKWDEYKKSITICKINLIALYLRVLINLLPDATNYFSPLILTVAIISLIYASFSTIIQQDSKRLIAYSSVAHMAVVVLGLFSNNLQGIDGAILLAIGHGFTSPALFICVGGILYDRTGTRIINYIRGLATYMPLFTIFFFIFTLCNTGIPLSINWLGELLSLMGIWQQNPIIACLGATGILLSACYSMFLYNRISYGNLSPYLPPLKDLNRREYYMLICLLIPTLVFGILPDVLLTPLHISVTSLLYVLPPITPF